MNLRRRCASALLAGGIALSAASAQACGDALGPAAQRLAGNGWQLAWRTQPAPVPVGRHFVLDIMLCASPGQPLPQGLRVDATMPEHRHGMNYRPGVSAQGDGRFRAEGLMFHMPGRWELVFEWRDAAGTAQRLAQTLDVG